MAGREMDGLLGAPAMATPGVTVTVTVAGECVTGTAGVRVTCGSVTGTAGVGGQ